MRQVRLLVTLPIMTDLMDKNTGQEILRRLERVLDDLDELVKPYLVCLCADAVEGKLIENRFTHECKTSGGAIPLKRAS